MNTRKYVNTDKYVPIYPKFPQKGKTLQHRARCSSFCIPMTPRIMVTYCPVAGQTPNKCRNIQMYKYDSSVNGYLLLSARSDALIEYFP